MLLFSRNSNQKTTKYKAAAAYLSQGFSLVPVLANKHSAVKWKTFQTQRPTIHQIQNWFSHDSYHGIAIITGRISKLAVLDFDTAEQIQKFSEQHPELTKTYIVKTHRGWHFYYHIPDDINTRSLKGQGIDWQWNGRYVVAPPTDGYQIVNNIDIHTLTQADIEAIEAFVKPAKAQAISSDTTIQSISKQELLALYHKQATVGQRNDTLFQTGLLAHDHGWSLNETINLLASAHAHNRQHHESIEQRRKEAIATLKSAFSRPARAIAWSNSLPNIIKETLCQSRLTAAIRVIEALKLLGYTEGEWLCRTEIIDALKGIVGEYSIIKTLTAIVGEEQSLFTTIKAHNPPSPPSEPKGTAINTPKGTISNCTEISYSKPHFSQRGRKTHFYQVPSTAEVAQRLGVPLSRIADELTLGDLKSAKLTRQTIYYTYIQRRPGKYPSRWLAKRLGVSIITKNRYDKEIVDLHKRPSYTKIRIYGRNLNEIPEDMDVPGMFLEDETGKRYPAKQVIAARLLKQGRRITLMKQGFNYYWVGSRFDVDVEQLSFEPKQYAPAQNFQNVREPQYETAAAYGSEVYSGSSIPSPDAHKRSQRVISGDYASSATQPSQNIRKALKGRGRVSKDDQPKYNPRRAFKDSYLENKAEYIQKRINKIAKSPKQEISLHSVRQLMIQHGHQEILKVIKRIAWRDNVGNPTGLIITILRSEQHVAELQGMMA